MGSRILGAQSSSRFVCVNVCFGFAKLVSKDWYKLSVGQFRIEQWVCKRTRSMHVCLSVCLPACLSVCLSLHSSIPMYLQFMHLWSYVGIELCRYVEIMIYTYMVRAGSPAPPMLPLPSNPRHNKASLHASHTYDLLTFMPVTQYL